MWDKKGWSLILNIRTQDWILKLSPSRVPDEEEAVGSLAVVEASRPVCDVALNEKVTVKSSTAESAGCIQYQTGQTNKTPDSDFMG